MGSVFPQETHLPPRKSGSNADSHSSVSNQQVTSHRVYEVVIGVPFGVPIDPLRVVSALSVRPKGKIYYLRFVKPLFDGLFCRSGLPFEIVCLRFAR